MFWVRSLLVCALVLLAFAAVERAPREPDYGQPILFVPAHAQDACTPNPNAVGPPFVNGCPVPASALTNIVGGAQAIGVAVCNGATDNMSVFQTALNTAGAAGGGTVVVPGGMCNISGTLTLPSNGVHVIGQGTLATIVNFTGTGTGDGFQLGTFPTYANCVGASPPSNCVQTFDLSIEKMSVYAQSRTGGFLFDINGATQVVLTDIQYISWDMLQLQYVNNVILQRVAGSCRDTTNICANMFQKITTGTTNGWYRSDVITFSDVGINENYAGGSCLNWDGPLYTVRISKMALLNCGYGFAINNTQASNAFFPQFLEANALEVDGNTKDGVFLNAGRDLHFTTCDVDNNNAATGIFPFVTGPDTGNSVTSGITLTNCSIHSASGTGLYINSRQVTVTGGQVYDTNHTATGTVPAVEIAANAADVQITGTLVGQRFGDPDAPKYGVQVDSGATAVSLVGNNAHGATTDGVNNLSAAAVSYVGGITNGGAANTANTCAATTACP